VSNSLSHNLPKKRGRRKRTAEEYIEETTKKLDEIEQEYKNSR